MFLCAPSRNIVNASAKLGSKRTLVTGLVGLPNVGKSSLFNALTSTIDGAEAANYPFCTIDPNKGIAPVNDATLDQLATVAGSSKTIPAVLEFLDIAGLVEGASKGEGLGNKFLGNIRECDAIIHVVRCFEDEEIIHVESSVDPKRDAEVINIELALSDLEQIEKKLLKSKKSKQTAAMAAMEAAVLQRVHDVLNEGKPARSLTFTDDERAFIQSLHLLTMKPQIFAANVDDMSLGDGNSFSTALEEYVAAQEYDDEGVDVGDGVVLCSAKFESDLVGIEDDEERAEYMEMCGLSSNETGLERLSRSTYDLLQLSHYYTVGPEEARAWTFARGDTAPIAAGKIHTDIRDGFIRADVVGSEDMIQHKTWAECKEHGVVRSEGKEYAVQHGDVCVFHHR
jgi:ribosome-binding ATPase